jgi:long-chain acyl-CoA synthetase
MFEGQVHEKIIVLSSGNKVAPELVENLVKESYLISHCMVYGDGKDYCVALITIDETEAANMCVEQIDGLVEQAVAHANSRVSVSGQIRRWKILSRDFSPELDEVTLTLTLKRNVIVRHFGAALEALYSEK